MAKQRSAARGESRAAARVCDLQLPGPVQRVGDWGERQRWPSDTTARTSKAVLKPVVKWESGRAAVGSRGDSSRGGGGIPKVQCRSGSGAGCLSTVEAGAADRRVWDGTGLDWDRLGLGRQQSCQGTTGKGGTGHERFGGGGGVLPKKAMRWGGPGRLTAEPVGGRPTIAQSNMRLAGVGTDRPRKSPGQAAAPSLMAQVSRRYRASSRSKLQPTSVHHLLANNLPFPPSPFSLEKRGVPSLEASYPRTADGHGHEHAIPPPDALWLAILRDGTSALRRKTDQLLHLHKWENANPTSSTTCDSQKKRLVPVISSTFSPTGSHDEISIDIRSFHSSSHSSL
ncbi:hypothetical protein KVR01_009716 [Diaporthe batatas]|uniref:uncharacterized protein n=1 Tax=Diaporthe batatas TaxID=748121 RepID=UPI001D04D477|nr:uncharacterized protein KVR01_009716 [Diaporthe batatas]KAG8160180.1 hypothetical protein KVR01_009716 [Diaporthe batatas]